MYKFTQTKFTFITFQREKVVLGAKKPDCKEVQIQLSILLEKSGKSNKGLARYVRSHYELLYKKIEPSLQCFSVN
jgi:hypothetical protein